MTAKCMSCGCEMSTVKKEGFAALFCYEHEHLSCDHFEEKKEEEKKYIGYIPEEKLPIKQGDTVTICKGVVIKDSYGRKHIAAKTYKIRINHILCGYEHDGVIKNPEVRWAGTGGYWMAVDVNDIPEAVPEIITPRC